MSPLSPLAWNGRCAQIDLGDQVVVDLRSHVLGLLAHFLHQPGPLDHRLETRVILHVRRDGHLAARLQPGDDFGFQICPRRIDRRRIAGRAGSDDENLAVMMLRHVEAIRRWRERGGAASATIT